MKSNALNNISNIAIYRLLGISKSNICLLYAIQILIISCYTTLIGILLTSGVLKFVGGIEAFDIRITCPITLVIEIIVVLLLVNVLIGLIPLYNILKLKPAQIASKYDM